MIYCLSRGILWMIRSKKGSKLVTLLYSESTRTYSNLLQATKYSNFARKWLWYVPLASSGSLLCSCSLSVSIHFSRNLVDSATTNTIIVSRVSNNIVTKRENFQTNQAILDKNQFENSWLHPDKRAWFKMIYRINYFNTAFAQEFRQRYGVSFNLMGQGLNGEITYLERQQQEKTNSKYAITEPVGLVLLGVLETQSLVPTEIVTYVALLRMAFKSICTVSHCLMTLSAIANVFLTLKSLIYFRH